MEVSYTTTLDDYVAYSWHLWRKSGAVRKNFLSDWLFLPALSFVGAAGLLACGYVVSAGVCAAVAVLYVAVYPTMYRRWAKRYIRDYAKEQGGRGVIGRIRLILSEESLVEITELTRSEARWRDMHGIEEFDDYTIIMVTGMTAAILPRHGFEREQDYLLVKDFARKRIGAGIETGAATDGPRE